MRLRLAYYLVTAAAFGVGGTSAVGPSFGVTGVVVDGGGAPIANAVVSLQKAPVLNLSATFPLKVVRAAGDADDSQQTTTDGQWSFAATGIQPPARLVAKPAAMISIDVADPRGILPSSTRCSAPVFVVGVKTQDNSFYVARLQSSSGGVLHYHVPVPLVQPLTLWLFSR